MTSQQFERVFSRAQDIQSKRFTKKEIEASEKAMKGFELEGVQKEATLEQAAYILNLMCMDMTGEYSPLVLIQLRDCYLKNVKILRTNGPAKKKKGKKK